MSFAPSYRTPPIKRSRRSTPIQREGETVAFHGSYSGSRGLKKLSFRQHEIRNDHLIKEAWAFRFSSEVSMVFPDREARRLIVVLYSVVVKNVGGTRHREQRSYHPVISTREVDHPLSSQQVADRISSSS